MHRLLLPVDHRVSAYAFRAQKQKYSTAKQNRCYSVDYPNIPTIHYQVYHHKHLHKEQDHNSFSFINAYKAGSNCLFKNSPITPPNLLCCDVSSVITCW